MTEVNPIAAALLSGSQWAKKKIADKKGSILGMHEVMLKHQLEREHAVEKLGWAHHLAEPGSNVNVKLGNGADVSYTKGGKAAPKKPAAAKNPAAPKKPPVKKAPVKKAPAAKPPVKTTAANTKSPTVTSTVPIKNTKTTRMSTRAGGRR